MPLTPKTPLTKDQWIQKAKALFFDCTFCVDSRGIKKEIDELLLEGGSYDPMTESSKTSLQWPDNPSS
jgi:hypothetical protein